MLACLLLWAPTCPQAIMIGLSTKELTRNSELALVGRVENVESHGIPMAQ